MISYLVIGICLFLLLAVIIISAKPISMGIEARRNINQATTNNETIEENDKYEISLTNGLHFEVNKYFDITKNKWNLENFSEKFQEIGASILKK